MSSRPAVKAVPCVQHVVPVGVGVGVWAGVQVDCLGVQLADVVGCPLLDGGFKFLLALYRSGDVQMTSAGAPGRVRVCMHCFKFTCPEVRVTVVVGARTQDHGRG